MIKASDLLDGKMWVESFFLLKSQTENVELLRKTKLGRMFRQPRLRGREGHHNTEKSEDT